MFIARQSTARTFTVGPILDADGVAVTTAVVGDLKLSKNGAAPAALNGSATLTHRHTGHYSLALTASDLDTVGTAEVVIDATTNAMAPKEISVIEEAVYDVYFAAAASGLIPGIQGTIQTLDALDTAQDSQHTATQGKVDTAQADLDLLTGTDGATLATSQPNYAPAKAGDQMNLANDAITSAKIAADAIGASELAADAVAEIQSGLATAAELAKVPKSDGTVSWNATAAAQIQSEANDALVAYDPPTRAEATADKEEILNSVPKVMLRTTVATAISNSIFTLTDGSPDNDAYVDCVAIFCDQSTATQQSFAIVQSYVAATKRLELSDDYTLTFTVAPGDVVVIIPSSVLNANQIPLSLGMASANLDTQLAGINTNIDSAESAIRGADSDTLKTLSDQVDGLPTAAENADAVWDEAIAGHAGAGSTGEALSNASGGSDPSAIADAVWDEAISGHLSAGSTGAALNAAGSAGDPWSTPIPGAYGAGTAGKLVGDEFQSELDSIKAKTDLISAAGVLTIVSPVSPDGDSLTIYANDDYLLAQKIAFTIPGGLWPDLTGQAVWLGIGENKELNAPLLVQAGTVDSGSASADQEISFSIDGDNIPSSSFFAGADLGFSIKAVYTSPAIGEKTIGSGRARVLRDFVGRAPT